MKKIIILLCIILIPTVYAKDIEITNVKYIKRGNTVKENKPPQIDGTNAYINNTFFFLDEEIIYIIDINNSSNLDYMVSKSPNSNYISYDLDFESDNNIIPSGTTKSLTLKVRYDNRIDEELLSNGAYLENNTLQLSKIIDNQEKPVINTIVEKFIENPLTTDNVIVLLTIIFIISTLTILILKKKRIKAVYKVMIILLLLSSYRIIKVCASSDKVVVITSTISIEKPVEATFRSGIEINEKMKYLANGTDLWYNERDEKITNFVRSETLNITPTDENIASTDDSEVPIYIWYEETNNDVEVMVENPTTYKLEPSTTNEGIMYWYSEANIVYFNEDSSYLFNYLVYLQNIDDPNMYNASKVVNAECMFAIVGSRLKEMNLNLKGLNFKNAENMFQMFTALGSASLKTYIDVSNWDTSNVKNLGFLFWSAFMEANELKIEGMDKWDTSKVVDISGLFQSAALNSEVVELDIGDFSNWDVSNVEGMYGVFAGLGRNIKGKWYIGDLSNWDVSNVTDMSAMFANTGINSSEWYIGDLSNWNTSNVIDMNSMFFQAGTNSSNWHSIGTLNVYADDITHMFYNSHYAKATLNIYNNPIYKEEYTDNYLLFKDAATEDDALITINYSNNTTNIDDIIATKSDNSNVVKGILLD